MQSVGNVQATVPLTALQTQTAESTLTTLQQTLLLQQSINSVKDATQNGTFFLNNAIQNVNTAVTSVTLATAIAIRDDGDKTHELINSIDRQNLSRQLAVAENTIVELRQGRDHDHRLEIQMINNQNQNQLQFQQQAQGLAFLHHGVAECNQWAKATKQKVLVGNPGVTTTGPQTANPTLTVSDLNRPSGAVFLDLDEEELACTRIPIYPRKISLPGSTFTTLLFASGLCRMLRNMQACCHNSHRNSRSSYPSSSTYSRKCRQSRIMGSLSQNSSFYIRTPT
ncbi:hypothetical protein [Citrobacter sp. R56]|uniref:hypothetical protein n=1 Tax=Citrobacter sp. R56 TaxID=1573676 RepID=UPI00193BAFEF|nr:hypothetical protein [Citrobacter sp. R56]QRG77527.1 hypothetical protein JM656_12895 [Citrobacter sp. R56]